MSGLKILYKLWPDISGKIHCSHCFSLSEFSTLSASGLLLDDRNTICYEDWCRHIALDTYLYGGKCEETPFLRHYYW